MCHNIRTMLAALNFVVVEFSEYILSASILFQTTNGIHM